MNRRVLVAGLIVTLPLVAILVFNIKRDPHVVDSPLIGRPAPAFALTPVGGGDPVSLSSLRGRPVVLNFWATWCVPCYQEHPVLTAAARRMGSDVQFLGVIYQDQEDQVARFLKKASGAGYPSLMDGDGKTAIAYGIYGVPETFFIDRTGTIVAKFVGPLSSDILGEYLRKTMGGESPGKAMGSAP